MNSSRLVLLTLWLLSAAFLRAQDTTNSAPTTSDAPATNQATPPPLGPDGLIALSDNLHPPYMAVYKGSVNGRAKPYGIQRAALYAAWLNRTLIWGEDSEPNARWDSLEGGGWQFDPWGDWVQQNPARRLILCVPIVPGKGDKGGTDAGEGAHENITLELGASGAYNVHYTRLAETLVKHHMGNTILRLGWEFPGGWYAWSVKNKEKAAAFAEYWRQIVTTMRAVPGAEKLEFAFNPTTGYLPYDPEVAYPGDDYVDYIGPDVYDDSYAKDTYPLSKDASPDEIEAIHEKVWNDVIYSKGAKGLAFWSEFAKKHHKPMCIPEWGVDHKPDHHGGDDDPYFIEQMYKFIQDPANNVAWHSYFDVQAPDGGHQLFPIKESDPRLFPDSAAKFQELFSLPASAPKAPASVAETTPVAPSPSPPTASVPASSNATPIAPEAPAPPTPTTNVDVPSNPPPVLPASVAVTQTAPIEQLDANGQVSGVTMAVVGTSYVPVRLEGDKLILKDSAGNRYRLDTTATDLNVTPK
jgi:hypothetical protein